MPLNLVNSDVKLNDTAIHFSNILIIIITWRLTRSPVPSALCPLSDPLPAHVATLSATRVSPLQSETRALAQSVVSMSHGTYLIIKYPQQSQHRSMHSSLHFKL